MVAGAAGVEVPVVTVFGPEVDFDLVPFAGGGELDGTVFGFVEGEVGKEGFLRELFAHRKDMVIKAMKPRLRGKKGLEGFRQGRELKPLRREGFWRFI